MTKVIATQSGYTPPRRSMPVQACVVAAMLFATGAVAAAEGDWSSSAAGVQPLPYAGAYAGTAPATVAPVSTLEISTSNLPRFDNFDGTSRTRQRVGMALLSPGRSAFGVTMGMSNLSPSREQLAGATPDNQAAVNLGLQYRYLTDGNRRIDITAWRDVARPNDALSLVQSREAGYGARVEMQLSSSHSAFVADKGFVGVQLDGGARISLKRSAGKPMVYYRSNF